MQPPQDAQPQLLIFPAYTFHAVVGELPLGVQQRPFLAVKAVDILHQAGGGSLLIGEEDGAPAQFPAQGGGEVGLMDGGKAIQQQGAFARAQRLTGRGESG